VNAVVARLKRVDLRDYGIAYAFIALFIGLSLASSHFLQYQNMSNIFDQWAAIGLLACGETICIISGVFDLSVGAIVSVSAVVACKVANSATPTVGLITGMATGLGLGIVNGVVIDRTRINSFIGDHHHGRPDRHRPQPALRVARPG
jgi:ribose transport system permease protein